VQLVAGGPPCQGFSMVGLRRDTDPRNQLFKCHLSVVELLRPQIVLLENVAGIGIAFKPRDPDSTSGRSGPVASYAELIGMALTKQGYHVQQGTIRAVDYGVPQLRPRFFTVGIRLDLFAASQAPDFLSMLADGRVRFLRSKHLPPDRPVTVSEAISDLQTARRTLRCCTDPESPPGFYEAEYDGPSSTYQKLMNSGMRGRAPNSRRLANHRAETVRKFKQIQRVCRKGVSLSAAERASIGIRKTVIAHLDGDSPSHTLTTLPDDLVHYSEPRIHTVREYARLQSFPDWFEFRGKFTTGGARRAHECPRYTQVGNAVPPLLAEAIGMTLARILKQGGARS
jgi:DNA (cytosine-5)-methyltransferase 1